MNKLEKLTIVISVYNEAEGLHIFWSELKKELEHLPFSKEVIFVNDGSIDGSKIILESLVKEYFDIKVINLSKNFGHEAAMKAGLDYCSGDAVICMDADLQHPPIHIHRMVEKYKENYEIVNMVRTKNDDAWFIKQFITSSFYFFLNKLSHADFAANASDFFLISKRVADIISTDFCERNRFLRGFIQSVGFQKTTLKYIAPKRILGKSKYSLSQLFFNSFIAIATFSNLPLYIGLYLSVIFGLISFAIGIYSIIMKLTGYVIPGYTTIVALITFLSAIQFFLLGIIGHYIGFIFRESKQRPIYLIESMVSKIEIEE